MGFRDPVTTATATDTGTSPTGPGVRVYQDAENPFGVVEWRTGIAGDVPATMSLSSFQQTVDGVLRSFGNRMVWEGSSANGVPPARVELNVEQVPAGGYESVGRWIADRLQVSSPLEAMGPAGAPTKVAGSYLPGWGDYGAGYEPLTFRVLPDGQVRMAGLIKPTAALGAGAQSAILILPDGCRPRYRQLCPVRIGGTVGRVDVLTDGQVIWVGNPAVGAGAAGAVDLAV